VLVSQLLLRLGSCAPRAANQASCLFVDARELSIDEHIIVLVYDIASVPEEVNSRLGWTYGKAVNANEL